MRTTTTEGTTMMNEMKTVSALILSGDNATMTTNERIALLDWLRALPAEQQPRTGDDAVRLASAWLLARRAGCSTVEIAGGVR